MRNRAVGYAIAVLALAAAGVAAGRWVSGEALAGRRTPASLPPSDLVVGTQFPDTPLVDSAGATIPSAQLFVQGGRVVVLIDPHCPSCTEVSKRWQQSIAAGAILPELVVGISGAGSDEIEAYRKAHGLAFAVYRDAAGRFNGHVHPYEFVVGAAGIIRQTSEGATAQLDTERIPGDLKP